MVLSVRAGTRTTGRSVTVTERSERAVAKIRCFTSTSPISTAMRDPQRTQHGEQQLTLGLAQRGQQARLDRRALLGQRHHRILDESGT